MSLAISHWYIGCIVFHWSLCVDSYLSLNWNSVGNHQCNTTWVFIVITRRHIKPWCNWSHSHWPSSLVHLAKKVFRAHISSKEYTILSIQLADMKGIRDNCCNCIWNKSWLWQFSSVACVKSCLYTCLSQRTMLWLFKG